MLILDEVSPLERIQLTASLSVAVRAITAGPAPLQRVKLAGEISRILALLGVSMGATPTLEFNLNDRAASENSIAAYLDAGLGDLPEEFQAYEAETLNVLAQTLGSEPLGLKARRFAHARNQGEQSQVGAFNAMAARGVKVDIDSAEVLRRDEIANQILRTSANQDPEFSSLNNTLASINDRYRHQKDEVWARLQVERAALRRGERNGREQLEAVEDELAKLTANYNEEFEEVRKRAVARQAAHREEKIEMANVLFEETGRQVINSILAASPITEAAAKEWAEKQPIDKAAAAKLSRLGYKKDDVVRDLAEFYRLTGGKSSAVRISAGGRRANAVGVEARQDEKIINLGTRFDKTVLFHELAHFLENDPIAKAASNGFLIKRREGNKTHSLRSLTGNRGYDAREVAYKDSWMDAYIGKVYGDGVTEVFSMGVQYLANPRDAAVFAAKDPMMFAMISGYLASPLTPAMSAKLHMHEGAVDSLIAKREEKASEYDQAIAKLAKGVKFTMDDWWEQNEFNGYGRELRDYKFDRKKDPTYLGSWGDYHLFEGIFKNRNTRRNSKGHLVVYTGSGRFDSQAIHGGIDTAKAYVALAQLNGTSLSSTWLGYFGESSYRDPKQAVINMAEGVLA